MNIIFVGKNLNHTYIDNTRKSVRSLQNITYARNDHSMAYISAVVKSVTLIPVLSIEEPFE